MKRFLMMLMVAALFLSIVAACGNNNEESSAGNKGSQNEKKEDVTIKMFQFKVEIADALSKLAEEYKKETGVTLEIETHGGGEDYGALLKAEFAGGSEPEIYNNGGFTALEPYMDRAADLSGESWVKNLIGASVAPTLVDGKQYGMPMNTEGYGLIYNKDLFAQAGITDMPKTLPQLEEAVKKLKSAGIVPFMSTNEWWSLGIHLVNVAFAYQTDPVQFIEDVKAGNKTIKGDPVFQDWLKLVDLIFNNAQEDKLTTDYATQVANFASGKAAMMQQGNWTQGDINKVNPNLNLGVLPLPINDKEGSVLIGVPNNWIVNSKSEHPEEAKAFLEWLVTSDTGKRYLTSEFKFMPAVSNVTATKEDIGSIAVSIQEQSGSAIGWHWDRFPDGVTQGFGAAMQEYMGAQINGDQLFEKLDKAIQDIVKK